MPKVAVKFVSVWDQGTEIESDAMLDIETGLIEDIAEVDAEDVETLDSQRIDFEGLSFPIEADDSNEYRLADEHIAIVAERAGSASIRP